MELYGLLGNKPTTYSSILEIKGASVDNRNPACGLGRS